ncbi:MAG: 50S ribosomal protein L9 [Oscillospiraceae bacterium]|nr:50S ribosomal protein L9 [Oscillospiraceae bacterium]
MKVILLQDIRGKGKKGQMIEASDGYARNFLLPRKMAIEATADNVNTMKMNDKAKAEQAAREKAQAQEFAEKLKEVTVEIKAKAGTGGRLFGSITSAEVSDALKQQFGIAIDKKKIVQDEPIKSFGTFSMKAKLGYEIVATISVHVSEA